MRLARSRGGISPTTTGRNHVVVHSTLFDSSPREGKFVAKLELNIRVSELGEGRFGALDPDDRDRLRHKDGAAKFVHRLALRLRVDGSVCIRVIGIRVRPVDSRPT